MYILWLLVVLVKVAFTLYMCTSGYLSNFFATILNFNLHSTLEAYQCTNHCPMYTRMHSHYHKTDIATWNGLTGFEVRWSIPRLGFPGCRLHSTPLL